MGIRFAEEPPTTYEFEKMTDAELDEVFYTDDEIGEMRYSAFMINVGLEEEDTSEPDVEPVPWPKEVDELKIKNFATNLTELKENQLNARRQYEYQMATLADMDMTAANKSDGSDSPTNSSTTSSSNTSRASDPPAKEAGAEAAEPETAEPPAEKAETDTGESGGLWFKPPPEAESKTEENASNETSKAEETESASSIVPPSPALEPSTPGGRRRRPVGLISPRRSRTSMSNLYSPEAATKPKVSLLDDKAAPDSIEVDAPPEESTESSNEAVPPPPPSSEPSTPAGTPSGRRRPQSLVSPRRSRTSMSNLYSPEVATKVSLLDDKAANAAASKQNNKESTSSISETTTPETVVTAAVSSALERAYKRHSELRERLQADPETPEAIKQKLSVKAALMDATRVKHVVPPTPPLLMEEKEKEKQEVTAEEDAQDHSEQADELEDDDNDHDNSDEQKVENRKNNKNNNHHHHNPAAEEEGDDIPDDDSIVSTASTIHSQSDETAAANAAPTIPPPPVHIEDLSAARPRAYSMDSPKKSQRKSPGKNSYLEEESTSPIVSAASRKTAQHHLQQQRFSSKIIKGGNNGSLGASMHVEASPRQQLGLLRPSPLKQTNSAEDLQSIKAAASIVNRDSAMEKSERSERRLLRTHSGSVSKTRRKKKKKGADKDVMEELAAGAATSSPRKPIRRGEKGDMDESNSSLGRESGHGGESPAITKRARRVNKGEMDVSNSLGGRESGRSKSPKRPSRKVKKSDTEGSDELGLEGTSAHKAQKKKIRSSVTNGSNVRGLSRERNNDNSSSIGSKSKKRSSSEGQRSLQRADSNGSLSSTGAKSKKRSSSRQSMKNGTASPKNQEVTLTRSDSPTSIGSSSQPKTRASLQPPSLESLVSPSTQKMTRASFQPSSLKSLVSPTESTSSKKKRQSFKRPSSLKFSERSDASKSPMGRKPRKGSKREESARLKSSTVPEGQHDISQKPKSTSNLDVSSTSELSAEPPEDENDEKPKSTNSLRSSLMGATKHQSKRFSKSLSSRSQSMLSTITNKFKTGNAKICHEQTKEIEVHQSSDLSAFAFNDLPAELKQKVAFFLPIGDVMNLVGTSKSMRSELNLDIISSPLTDSDSQNKVYRTGMGTKCIVAMVPDPESSLHTMRFTCDVRVGLRPFGRVWIVEQNLPVDQDPEHLERLGFHAGKVVAKSPALDRDTENLTLTFPIHLGKLYQFYARSRIHLHLENMTIERVCFQAKTFDYIAYQFDAMVKP